MPTDKNKGGAAHHRRRGLKASLVSLTPWQHEVIQLAAGTYTGRDRAVTRFIAAAAEAAALARLREIGVDPPAKEKPEKS
jgi:hypothetical protein